ncbi:hypothetical protein [Pseudoalteromonas phenolica]|uniref:hypothetical protein n=1 Tax=Pseudoalteromonas phenolica TaxID=161398 RepID=UPI000FFEF8C3|nr:hypothetical protein [Pseudoalteromonas phenolica]RXF04260.1 hypothetical protein D9981_04540 [Pseudoalteromonas phenolica O-BC30]
MLSTISLCLLSTTAHAEYDRYWLEISEGLQYGSSFKFKVRDNDSGWAFVHSKYTEEEFFGTTNLNRVTKARHDAEFKVYGVTRFVSMPFSWGYVDAGAGLGYGKGTWSENCEHYQNGFLGTSDICDLKDGTSIGIPVHVSASWGKFIGIGVNFDVFLSLERDTTAQVGFVIPFGLFTK